MNLTQSESPGEKCACGYVLRGVHSERCPECGRNVAFYGEAPLAAYCERRFRMRRDFTLYPDRVVILKKQTLGTGVWLPIPLESLNPNPTTIWIRSKNNTWLLLLCVGLPMIYMGFEYPKVVNPTALCCAGAVTTLAGLVLLGLYLRILEYARFHAKDRPELVLLDIGRVGPDAAKFNDFVAAIRSAIKASGLG